MLETRGIKIRLIHDGAQPGPIVPGRIDFGIQDKKGTIHIGKPSNDRLLVFEIDVAVKSSGASTVFSGPFLHGPPSGRFLYLSWKKRGQHEHPWAWRIKVPLGDVGSSLLRQAQKSGNCLEANVVGRRPHVTERVAWRVVRST